MSARSAEVVWHDLECGGYRADLPLWRELAARERGAVLEIGAGSGRVSLELARAGHSVTALDREPALLDALRARLGAADVQTVCADARSFALGDQLYALCLVPLQTIQLLGGGAGRAAFLRCARSALRPGGLLACAVLAQVEPFACAAGDRGPEPETALIDGLLYASAPTRVTVGRRSVAIERERRVFQPAPGPLPARAHVRARECVLTSERSVVELDQVSPRRLEREALAAGLRAEGSREIPPTAHHAGSTVVMLRA